MTDRKKSPAAKVLLALLLLVAPVLSGQAIPFDFELGYRWLDVNGNESMYRTQINEDQGLLIRHLTLATGDFGGRTTLVDRFRIDISDLGAGPAGSLRMQADREGAYRLRLNYRGTEAFSGLPVHANPLLGRGITPGQHTYDRTRQMIDVDLELAPGHAITPFLGYGYNENHSDGTSTYALGQDEFLLNQRLEEEEREFRVGADFKFTNVFGRVEQGWRSVYALDTLTLANGTGNNLGNVLGQPVTASSITRRSTIDGRTPFTNIFVTGRAGRFLQLTGDFVRFNAVNEGPESEDAAGSFASFALGRFFTGLSEDVNSRAQNETWRGGARAEVEFTANTGMTAGWRREHSEVDGTALVRALFLQSVTFGGVDRRDLQELLEMESSMDRTEETFHVSAFARSVGPFSVRAEYRARKQDVSLTPGHEEIVVPGNQDGSFERDIDTFDGTAAFTMAGFNIGAAYRSDRSDEAIFRTDYLDRDRIRVRASYVTPNDMFRIGLTGEDIDQTNDKGGVGYDAETRQWGADLEVAPVTMLRLRAGYSEFDTDSTVRIRRPENFQIIESLHFEEGESVEGGIGFRLSTLAIDASLIRFENEGSIPFQLDRQRVRVSYDFPKFAGLAFEWDEDEYDEAADLGDYDATRYGLFLRLR